MTNQLARKYCLIVALLTVFCASPVVAYGQDNEEDEGCGKCDVPGGKLQIRNDSDSTEVHFAMRNGTSDWVNFSLGPHRSALFTTSTNLRIRSKNGTVKIYRLEDKKRYSIYWNEPGHYWALARLEQEP